MTARTDNADLIKFVEWTEVDYISFDWAEGLTFEEMVAVEREVERSANKEG